MLAASEYHTYYLSFFCRLYYVVGNAMDTLSLLKTLFIDKV